MKRLIISLRSARRPMLMVAGAALLIPILLASWRPWRGHSDAVLEIVPPQEQVQIIKDIVNAQRQSNAEFQAQLSGAIRTLMSITKDPNTGKPLDPKDGWQAAPVDPGDPAKGVLGDMAKGIKFVRPAPSPE